MEHLRIFWNGLKKVYWWWAILGYAWLPVYFEFGLVSGLVWYGVPFACVFILSIYQIGKEQ